MIVMETLIMKHACYQAILSWTGEVKVRSRTRIILMGHMYLRSMMTPWGLRLGALMGFPSRMIKVDISNITL